MFSFSSILSVLLTSFNTLDLDLGPFVDDVELVDKDVTEPLVMQSGGCCSWEDRAVVWVES